MSAASPSFDVSIAHRFFAADCFNRTWALMEKSHRSPAEDEAMVLTALASLWHWTQREDCTEHKLSVGHWQVSRVYALVGDGAKALCHAEQALRYAGESSPFYLGYAHEALARATHVLGREAEFHEHLSRAKACAIAVADADERTLLEDDLKSLG